MELFVIYAFVGVVSIFGILNIKDVKVFDVVNIKSIYILSLLTAVNVPLMIISMIILKDIALTLLMVTLVICEALRIGAFYTENKVKKQNNSMAEKVKNNRESILRVIDSSDANDEDLFFKQAKNKKRAI